MASVKRTTQRAARVVADDIARPHGAGPSAVKKIGAQDQLEAADLSGANGRRGSESVRQVGPTDIRQPNGPTGSVRYVGTKNFEDVFATQGLGTPYARQSGSVKQVGPADRSFTRLGEGSGAPGTFRSGRLPRTNAAPITETPLLKSGVGRTHPRAVFAGQPGAFATRAARRISGGSVGGSVLISGRRRGAGIPLVVESEGETQVTPGQPIVPGAGERIDSAPTIIDGAASAISDTEATLNAEVNPRGLETTFYFEYGLDDTYGDTTPGDTLPAGDAYVDVSDDITGLDPDTEYHFRVVAENDEDLVEGEDQTFTTDAAP